MFDELMVASPLAQKRHKRSIHRQKHILYKKSGMNNEMFHFDTVKGNYLHVINVYTSIYQSKL